MEDVSRSAFRKEPEYFNGCFRELEINGEEFLLIEAGIVWFSYICLVNGHYI